MGLIRNRWMFMALSCSLFLSLLLPALPGRASADGAGAEFMGRLFQNPEKIDTPIEKAGIAGAVVGEENGRQVFYTVVNAEEALFQVVDIKKNELLYSLPMQDVQQSWTQVIAPDGTVYIGGIRTSGEKTQGTLWQYSPTTHELTRLGEPIPGEKSIWSMTTDDKGNVYGGTFQTGKVFKYDPVTKTFTDYGSMVEGQEYVRSMAYYDGYIYAGIGTQGDVIKLGVTEQTKGTKVSIAGRVPELLGVAAKDVPFAYDMAVVGDYLLVKFTGDLYKLLIYDLKNGQWLDHVYGKDDSGGGTGVGVFSFAQLATKGSQVFIPANGHVASLDLETFELKLIAKYGTSLRGSAFVAFDDGEGSREPSLVSMTASGEIVIINVETGAVRKQVSVLSGAPNPLHNIEVGPDGNLYMSAYPAGMGAVYNPKTGERKNLIMEQAEGMVAFGSDMYLGIYPGGHLYKIDTSRSTPEAEHVLTIGESQDRPYIMKVMEDKIIMGTIPGYGELGGALTIFDPASGGHEVFRNIVQNQSIVGLAYKDGLIYGSTTVYGGLGIEASEKSAKIFVWDVANKKKIAEFVPDIPGLANPAMISGLSVGPDGNIWGGVNGTLFKLDPETYEVLDYKVIYPDISPRYGMWRPYHPHWGKDGLLYMDLADRITVINPKNMDFIRLFPGSEEVKFMTIAEDGSGNESIYFADATDMGSLQKIAVTDKQYEHAGYLKLAGPETVRPNETVTVRLEAEKANELYGFKANLVIDPEVWELKGVKASSGWSEQGMLTWTAKANQVTIVGTQLKDRSFNGKAVIAELELTAKQQGGQAALTLLGNSETIRLDGDETGVTHRLGEDQTLVIHIGGASQANEDINGDGKIDMKDMQIVAANIGKPVTEANTHMDVNGDGKIDIADLGLVGRKALK